jgi:hypothetical protein
MRTLKFPAAARWLVLGAALLAGTAASLSAHAVGNLADVRIFDRTEGRQLQVYWHEGRPYVVGRPGNEYEIVVRNRAGDDLLAVVSVDGVNAVSGQTAGTQQSGYVVRPGAPMRIRGWRKNLDETAAFYFTSLGDSYAGRTGRPENVGVIGVAVFEQRRRWIPREELGSFDFRGPKRAEAQSEAVPGAKSHRAPAPSAPLGTGHGRREDSPARYAEFERASDYPVETITIYYDSHRNLVAQGVIAAPRRPADPNPFPIRFAPDPWR